MVSSHCISVRPHSSFLTLKTALTSYSHSICSIMFCKYLFLLPTITCTITKKLLFLKIWCILTAIPAICFSFGIRIFLRFCLTNFVPDGEGNSDPKFPLVGERREVEGRQIYDEYLDMVPLFCTTVQDQMWSVAVICSSSMG
jgi:hypothetical protein